jgi:hypothetical protein
MNRGTHLAEKSTFSPLGDRRKIPRPLRDDSKRFYCHSLLELGDGSLPCRYMVLARATS